MEIIRDEISRASQQEQQIAEIGTNIVGQEKLNRNQNLLVVEEAFGNLQPF